MSDDLPAVGTTEQQHTHVCPVDGDSWQHTDADCQEPEGDLPMAWVRRTWAKCPLHEGQDE